MRSRASLILILLATGFALPLRADNRVIPPAISKIWPVGLQRGTTETFTLDGRNLSDVKAIIFDTPDVTAKVVQTVDIPEQAAIARAGVDLAALVPQGKKQTVTIEITAGKETKPGLHWFRIRTPLGTSDLAAFEVGAFREAHVNKAGGSGEMAELVSLPATLVGTIAVPGESDSYEFDGRAGEELVFKVTASELGSKLESLLIVRNAAGQKVAQSGEYDNRADAVLTYRLPEAGKYTLSVSDREKGGGPDRYYRVDAGPLLYITGVFPLGVRAGQSASVDVTGVNLGNVHDVKVNPPKSADGWTTMPLEVRSGEGWSLNTVKLAVGSDPEILEQEPNNSPSQPQVVSLPITINGRIASGAKSGGAADEDYFRFHARKDEHLAIEVAAARLGSPLDSVIEVLDAKGHPIPRATVRCLNETTTTLSDRDSRTSGIRLVSTSGLRENDYVMVGDELDQIAYIPDQPDADTSLKSIRGLREAFLGTSPDVHAVNTPVYKAEILPPDAQFPENGLPVFHLTWRNDDGGPGYGPDSRLDFVAPRDGDYILHLKDVRGLQGPDFAYRVTLRDAMPSYELEVDTNNPNIPKGGSMPVTVSADRLEGYKGPIRIEVKGLPHGVTASPATIPEGQNSTVAVLSAGPEASADAPPAPIQIVGHASVNGRDLIRIADADAKLQLASVIPPPDVVVTAEPTDVVVEPGKETTVTLHVARQNGFKGRVPCDVMNLPPGVRVVNVGLNGVLVTETQTSRTFTLKAEDWAKPIEQPIYVVGQVESNSSTLHSSPPLLLRVENKQEVASADTGAKSGK